MDRCSDTSDRKIIHRDASLDTRFISLPSFRVSSRVCLYGVCVCVCVATPPPRPLSHTHTDDKITSARKVVPVQLFASSPARASYRKGRRKEKKKKKAPSPEPNPITRNRM